jgi:TonB family protein
MSSCAIRPGRVPLGVATALVLACVSPPPSTPAHDSPEPPLDAAAVRRVVAAGEAGVQACYEAELDRLAEAAPSEPRPPPEGRVRVAFDIDAEGRVQDPGVVETEIPGHAFERCLLGEVGRWRFPRPRPAEAPVGVEVPFHFVPTVAP